ncbi:MAG: CbtA family protein [Rhodobacteraceae bacterium]|nr:CbtA family protein [Paracoccaceae bacterium]
MLGRIVTSALFAGFAAGLIAALLQLALVQPVLLEAEQFETGARTLVETGTQDPAGPAVHEHGHDHGAAAHSHGTGGDTRIGGIAPLRDGLSVLFSIVVYTGYAFFLVAAMAVAADRGVAVTARRGILWGLAGYVAFQLAPAVGLPPEVPGSVSADLAARQIWWIGTTLATALGLALIAFGRDRTAWGAAIVLLAAPHVIGAPQADGFGGVVPAELAGAFASRALGVGMAVWAALGLACGYFWQREGAARQHPRTA